MDGNRGYAGYLVSETGIFLGIVYILFAVKFWKIQTKTGGDAGEVETSMLLSHRPDLVHVDSGKNQSGQSVSEPYKCN